ncbi:MAG: thioredoxin domain-containing protein, partial [Flavisolibacter sp.]|nr:thioredoxin domain-containing protein [Flavisolibacter sp.]
AAEAARQQGKFWEFHDSAFRYNLDKGLVTVCSIADSLKLNHNQFEIYRTSEAARNKIARTVAQAKQLGILETPSVFINGKLLGDFKFKPVETVVRHILNMPPMIYPKED